MYIKYWLEFNFGNNRISMLSDVYRHFIKFIVFSRYLLCKFEQRLQKNPHGVNEKTLVLVHTCTTSAEITTLLFLVLASQHYRIAGYSFSTLKNSAAQKSFDWICLYCDNLANNFATFNMQCYSQAVLNRWTYGQIYKNEHFIILWRNKIDFPAGDRAVMYIINANVKENES